MKISTSGLKGLALGFIVSLFFIGLSWLELGFFLGLGVAGYFLGLLHERLPDNDGDSS